MTVAYLPVCFFVFFLRSPAGVGVSVVAKGGRLVSRGSQHGALEGEVTV